MKKLKKILIIFPDSHLAYSPTTLNLKLNLKKTHIVKLLVFYESIKNAIDDEDVIYLKGNHFLFRIFNFILNYIYRIKEYNQRNLFWQKACVMFHVLTNRYDEIIAVDLKSLWYLKFINHNKIHLLSLELTENTTLYKPKINFNRLCSIIIQNEDRLNYLVNENFHGKVFYLQNAPASNMSFVNKIPSQKTLIYSGTARFQFGIVHCLEFINKYDDYTLTIQGFIEPQVLELIQKKYNHLIETKRLIISVKYLTEKELLNFVNQYRIGFCFYDFSFPDINNFNYLSAPSGKMFTYFASGVPVIGNNILGLNPISNFNAGVQIDSHEPEKIKVAIDKIEENYNLIRENCFIAAKNFDFDKNVEHFLKFINTDN